MIREVCPVPSRWSLDELAGRLAALEAAERELEEARAALYAADGPGGWDDLDRYIAALTERNVLRDGRP